MILLFGMDIMVNIIVYYDDQFQENKKKTLWLVFYVYYMKYQEITNFIYIEEENINFFYLGN